MCTISNLGSSALSQIANQKQGPNKSILATDLKSINTDGDKTVTLDEMKVAVAKVKGVSVEELALSETDIAGLTEDAKDLTSFIRRGGELASVKIEDVNVFSFNPDTKLKDIKAILNSDDNENPITLTKGQNNPAVRQLKIVLNNLNINNPNFTPFSIDPKDPNSSKFDDRLFDVIKQFQANPNHDLIGKSTEGVVDKKTFTKIFNEANNIIKDDVLVPFKPKNENISVATTKKEQDMNAVREKIYSQLIVKLKTIPAFKDMTDEQLKQVIQERLLPVGKSLYKQDEQVIKEAEAKSGWTSNGYCASGVKEAMERELNIPYVDGHAADIDTELRNNFKDVFAELTLTKEEVMNLPPEIAVVVVHERGGKSDYGHIGIYSTVEDPKNKGNFVPSQISDKVRPGFSYSGNKFSVFLPLKPLEQGDKRFVSDSNSFSDNKLEFNIKNKKHDGMRKLAPNEVATRKQELAGYNPVRP